MKKIKGIPQVPFDLSARLVKEDESKAVYFIDKDFGLKNGLSHRMNFKCIHPTRPNMCEILIQIDRV